MFQKQQEAEYKLETERNEGIICKVQSRNEYSYPLGHTSRWNSFQGYHLEQWFSTFLKL